MALSERNIDTASWLPPLLSSLSGGRSHLLHEKPTEKKTLLKGIQLQVDGLKRLLRGYTPIRTLSRHVEKESLDPDVIIGVQWTSRRRNSPQNCDNQAFLTPDLEVLNTLRIRFIFLRFLEAWIFAWRISTMMMMA